MFWHSSSPVLIANFRFSLRAFSGLMIAKFSQHFLFQSLFSHTVVSNPCENVKNLPYRSRQYFWTLLRGLWNLTWNCGMLWFAWNNDAFHIHKPTKKKVLKDSDWSCKLLHCCESDLRQFQWIAPKLGSSQQYYHRLQGFTYEDSR